MISSLVLRKLKLNGLYGRLARGKKMQYELRFKVIVVESQFRSGWFAKLEVEGAGEGPDSLAYLTGNGDNAVAAVQSALAHLAQSNTYPQLILETGLMFGTRTAKREIGDGKKKR